MTDTFWRDHLLYPALESNSDLNSPDARASGERMTSASYKCNSSMQLTRASDYAVRVLIHLATLPSQTRVLLPELASATDAPESFLSKVLQSLAHAGLISSRRGKLGGFAILSHGRDATILQVIEAIDGPVCLNVCLNGGKDCDRKSTCPAHPVWARAQRAMFEVLISATVSSLAAKTAPSPPLSSLPVA